MEIKQPTKYEVELDGLYLSDVITTKSTLQTTPKGDTKISLGQRVGDMGFSAAFKKDRISIGKSVDLLLDYDSETRKISLICNLNLTSNYVADIVIHLMAPYIEHLGLTEPHLHYLNRIEIPEAYIYRLELIL